MSVYDEEGEVAECSDCGSSFRVGAPCEECDWSQETAEERAAEAAAQKATTKAPEKSAAEPVYERRVEVRAFPVHEPAWCPYCVAWLGTFPSKEAARAYEARLENHPVEFCLKRKARLNGSEEWRLRHEAGKRGSLAATRPTNPRAPSPEVVA